MDNPRMIGNCPYCLAPVELHDFQEPTFRCPSCKQIVDVKKLGGFMTGERVAPQAKPRPAEPQIRQARVESHLLWPYRVAMLIVLLGSFLAILICTVTVADIRRELLSPKFNYKSFFVHDEADFNVPMNALGEEGWEVLSVRRATAHNKPDQWGYEMVLKRRK